MVRRALSSQVVAGVGAPAASRVVRARVVVPVGSRRWVGSWCRTRSAWVARVGAGCRAARVERWSRAVSSSRSAVVVAGGSGPRVSRRVRAAVVVVGSSEVVIQWRASTRRAGSVRVVPVVVAVVWVAVRVVAAREPGVVGRPVSGSRASASARSRQVRRPGRAWARWRWAAVVSWRVSAAARAGPGGGGGGGGGLAS
ncbi:hypothetical protein BJP25_31605 [Actinokineospora bangkokensis]|uniref:Uncharacterized protein n=1 Tax=Actinokineospora bangkokensis TaxID=1193682 RepID=A0A1Q9LGB0_9PSEU|nr:hypothetical protein BJP25_31605 [Actinokineospora bangkokensis]